MTRALFIRHAHHALVGRALAGRSDIGISAPGLREAQALAQRFADSGLTAIYTSPQRRARETAAPLALRLALEPHVEPALDEIDFGEWTGKAFDALDADPQWRVWCERRSVAQPPNGERFADVQRRVVAAMLRLAANHPGETIALVSHGDVIKAALAHVMRVSLDDLERFDVAPASVSAVTLEGDWARVESLNAL